MTKNVQKKSDLRVVTMHEVADQLSYISTNVYEGEFAVQCTFAEWYFRNGRTIRLTDDALAYITKWLDRFWS